MLSLRQYPGNSLKWNCNSIVFVLELKNACLRQSGFIKDVHGGQLMMETGVICRLEKISTQPKGTEHDLNCGTKIQFELSEEASPPTVNMYFNLEYLHILH